MSLTIVHLSDIHIHSDEDKILAMANEIASTAFISANDSKVVVIAITGDIAFSGSNYEYLEAEKFINIIKNKIIDNGADTVEIVIVPGNHDCILKPQNIARSMIIESLLANPEKANENSIIEICTAPQKEFFDFRNRICTLPPIYEHKLYNEYEILVDGKVIRFSAINASWMSQLPENPGELIFPASLISEIISEPAELRFVLIHHPLNWYCPHTYHELRTLIRTHATAVLSGHEHTLHSGEIREIETGNSLYFEAKALQPHSHGEAGYSILHFKMGEDPRNRTVKQTKYEIVNSEIIEKEKHEFSLDGINSTFPKLSLNRDFLKGICDPGGGFIHPDKEHLTIDDIFVYPELRRKKNKEEKDNITNEKYSYSSESIFFDETDKINKIIIGEDKAGKSTLAYQLFKDYHNHGYAPLLLKCGDLGNSNFSDFPGILQKNAAQQYSDPKSYIRAEKQKQILILDDIDRLKGGLSAILKFIKSSKQHSESIILIASNSFEISEMVNKDLAESLKEFETYEITKFGHSLRHKLIRKWCLCGQVETLTELDKQIHEIENLVNIVVGKNLVPSQPFYLLILLQSSSSNQQAELKNSSFAHYYEYLMTGNLTKSGVKRDQYDELFNYLSYLAWYFRDQNKIEASETELRQFHEQFSKLFVKSDLLPRLSLLISAKLIKKRGEYYSFSYPYVYFFFLGRYLAKNLFKPEIKSVVSSWCSELFRRNNAHAILFLTYHVNDPWVINQVSNVLSNCFSSLTPIQLNGDISYINELVEQTTNQLLIEDRDVDKNQSDIRKLRDQHDHDNSQEDADEDGELIDIGMFRELHLFMKTAEILGQIVKNYYGSLERDDKQEMIKQVLDAPLRFLRFLYELIHNDPEAFVIEIEKIVLKKNPELQSLKKRTMARNVAFNVLGQITTGILIRASSNISSDKLEDDVSDVVDENDHTSYKLMQMGSKFISPKNLPYEDIKKLATQLKSNPFAFKILQSFGAIHIHQFHLRTEDKQKLCSILGITLDTSKSIEIQTKKTKLLNR